MYKRSRKLNVVVLTLLSLIFFVTCEDINDDIIVSPEDSLAALGFVQEANDAMEEIMDEMMNAEPDSVQEMLDMMDFSTPYALYTQANTHDPTNLDANFGLAFTGFLMVSQDDALQEMLLSWESYFNTTDPFSVDASMSRSIMSMPTDMDGIRLPVSQMIEIPIAMSRMSVDDVPQFSELQAIVSSLLLPIVDQSIASLELVDDNPDYVFTITAGMQGETEADPIELDLTEIYLIEAGLYGLKGILNTIIAYNFDFVSHDSLGIMTELSQGSDFATLNDEGSAFLALSQAAAITALERVEMGLDFLEAEVDDQSDDIIILDDMEDLEEVRDALADAQGALQGPTLIHYSYWDDIYEDGYWIGEEYVEDSVEVDISQFFLNPIDDFKAMLPPYIMDTDIEYEYEWTHISQPVNVEDSNVTVENLNNTYIAIDLVYYFAVDGPHLSALVNMGFFQFDLTTANPDDLPASVWEMYDEFLGLVDAYSGALFYYPHLSFHWSGNVTTGQSMVINGNVNIEYEERVAAYVVPDPSWVATTYSEWLDSWPDPTMQGIFPGLDAAGLAKLLDFDEADWQDL